MQIRSLSATLSLVGLALMWTVPSVMAECSPGDTPPDRHLDVGYAFTATVVEVSSDVDPPRPDGAPFNWHVVLQVDRSYRGDVPVEIVFNGWTAQCWFGVRGDQLQVGERLFVAGQRLRLERFPTDPFAGDLALWTWTGERWRYARDVLTYDGPLTPLDPDSRAVRAASTTGEILALIRADAPDTSITSRDEPHPATPPLATLGLAFVGGLGACAWRLRRRAP